MVPAIGMGYQRDLITQDFRLKGEKQDAGNTCTGARGPGDAWPNEAQDFTPWLVEHLELLGAELELDLKFVDKEVTLPGAGRVDILARQT